MSEIDWSKVSHYEAVINADFPRYTEREVGRYLRWEDVRAALVAELDKLYPGMWEVNYEGPQKGLSQYSPTDEYWHTGNFCMGLIYERLNELDELEKDIERLTRELAAKREQLAVLKGN